MKMQYLLAMALIGFNSSTLYGHTLSEDEAYQLGTEAYIYAYPLVTMEMTRRVMTNVATVDSIHGPMGQFVSLAKYPEPQFHDVTTPNADTLYTFAWIDLSKEPYILEVPFEEGRYYLMPILDAWTTVFASPGKRTTGTDTHKFAIIGPHWEGKLPKTYQQYHSATNMAWIIGRTYCTGTPEDYAAVNAIQKEYTLTPLSAYGKPYTPPKGTVDPNIDMKTPVKTQVNNLDGEHYFTLLASLLKDNPPYPTDAPIVQKLEKLGIMPGQPFDFKKLDPQIIKGLDRAVKNGQTQIVAHAKKAGVDKNGWVMVTRTGEYGTDYLQRAFLSYMGLGANLPQDAIYPATLVDAAGKRLNGANQYVMNFKKGNLPPVKGFWSLTLYDDQFFFYPNALNRYTLSERDHLNMNQDGSVDLIIQHDSPGQAQEHNWLPAPAGDFNLILRLYWPDEQVIKGQWTPPGVVKRVG